MPFPASLQPPSTSCLDASSTPVSLLSALCQLFPLLLFHDVLHLLAFVSTPHPSHAASGEHHPRSPSSSTRPRPSVLALVPPNCFPHLGPPLVCGWYEQGASAMGHAPAHTRARRLRYGHTSRKPASLLLAAPTAHARIASLLSALSQLQPLSTIPLPPPPHRPATAMSRVGPASLHLHSPCSLRAATPCPTAPRGKIVKNGRGVYLCTQITGIICSASQRCARRSPAERCSLRFVYPLNLGAEKAVTAPPILWEGRGTERPTFWVAAVGQPPLLVLCGVPLPSLLRVRQCSWVADKSSRPFVLAPIMSSSYVFPVDAYTILQTSMCRLCFRVIFVVSLTRVFFWFGVDFPIWQTCQ
ncbi:hypothetical protein B0H13DRAFT_2340235 [Mycena leptocephala]|nr:hypothetical protein B0H13DRAFT_2340235 [Mycena leptocephala]